VSLTRSPLSLLLARTKVLALALRSPAASMKGSRIAAVAAPSGLAAAAAGAAAAALDAIIFSSAASTGVGVTAASGVELLNLMPDRAKDVAAANVAAADTAAVGVVATSWAVPGAAPSLLLLAFCSRLLLSSLLLSLVAKQRNIWPIYRDRIIDYFYQFFPLFLGFRPRLYSATQQHYGCPVPTDLTTGQVFAKF
jgi:hypothetical protein